MSEQDKELFEFDGFRLDPAERLLLRDGEPVPLEPKVFETLLMLIRHSGRLVGKDELMKAVWPDSFVEEVNLARNVSILRKALDRGAGSQSKIETVTKRGYRFVGEVRNLSGEPASQADQSTQHESGIRTDPEPSVSIEREHPSIPQGKRRTAGVVLALVTLLLAVAAALYYLPRGKVANPPTSNAPIASIAVLPFANAANDPGAEYLSDGISESLINRLSLLTNLKVMSSSAVLRYKGKSDDAQKVGSELNVGAVLTGSVKQIDNQLVINVSLDDARDNSHIWGEQYVRPFADVLAVQNEIVQEVSTNLRLKLTGPDERQLARRYTNNVEAYRLCLKGNYAWNKHTREDYQRAINFYNQALEEDPDYAVAYVGLSGSYAALGINYLPPQEGFPKARTYAEKALAIDDALADAHTAMGAVELFYDWNFAGAENEFKRALTLDPNSAGAHQLYGDCLEIMGRFEEAQEQRNRCLEIDPLWPGFNTWAGFTLYLAGRYTEAIAQLEKTIDLESRFVPAYLYLGQAYEQNGMYEQAIATYQRGMTQAERHPQLVAALGHAYALAGKRDEALKALAELREMSKQRYISPYLFAVVYTGLDDKDQAIAWLEKAHQDRSNSLIWLRVEPLFAPLRDDSRFQDLLRRVGLARTEPGA